jgi:hypothetical protein
MADAGSALLGKVFNYTDGSVVSDHLLHCQNVAIAPLD